MLNRHTQLLCRDSYGRGLASKRRTGSRHEDGGNTHASLSDGLSVIQPMLFTMLRTWDTHHGFKSLVAQVVAAGGHSVSGTR